MSIKPSFLQLEEQDLKHRIVSSKVFGLRQSLAAGKHVRRGILGFVTHCTSALLILRGARLSLGQSPFLLLYLLCLFHEYSNMYRIQLSMLQSQLTPPLLCSASTNSLFPRRLHKLILLNCLRFFVLFSCSSRDSNVDDLGLPRLLITEMMSGLLPSTIISYCTLKSYRTLKSPFF